MTGHISETLSEYTKGQGKNINENMKINIPGIKFQLEGSKFGKRKYNRVHCVEGAWDS